jgi:prevent-host-death family protein
LIESLGVREARRNLPTLLDRAENGSPTVITRSGKPVALMVPAGFFDFLLDLASVTGGWEKPKPSDVQVMEARKRELGNALMFSR